MNADGIEEIYIADDDGQIWVVESTGLLPPEGKPFSPGDFYKLGYIAPEKTIRGGLLGDQDGDGKLDIYYCGHERNNIFEIEYREKPTFKVDKVTLLQSGNNLKDYLQ